MTPLKDLKKNRKNKTACYMPPDVNVHHFQHFSKVLFISL